MRACLIALGLFGFAPVAWAEESVRIAVETEAAQVQLKAASLSFAEDDDDPQYVPLGADEVRLTVVRGAVAGLPGSTSVESVRLRGAGSSVTVNGLELRGEVVVSPGRRGLNVVNVVSLENYLVGVIGSEMPKSFPTEALKAQAVAARTFALHKKLLAMGQSVHLGSSVLSQVYKGLAVEDERTREAVRATEGLVVTHQLQPIEAYFHASCGGRTASGLEALGRNLPYLRPVHCPCEKLPQSRWSLTLDASELASAVGGRTTALSVMGRTPTGRARRVQVSTERSVDAVTFRERVGYTKLKSLLFDVTRARGGWEVTGRGYGHGAGLCQWGAKALADAGRSYSEILAHYYPGTELQKLY